MVKGPKTLVRALCVDCVIGLIFGIRTLGIAFRNLLFLLLYFQVNTAYI